jgi:hypothetical protein
VPKVTARLRIVLVKLQPSAREALPARVSLSPRPDCLRPGLACLPRFARSARSPVCSVMVHHLTYRRARLAGAPTCDAIRSPVVTVVLVGNSDAPPLMATIATARPPLASLTTGHDHMSMRCQRTRLSCLQEPCPGNPARSMGPTR